MKAHSIQNMADMPSKSVKIEMQVWNNTSQGATFRIITEIKQKRETVFMLKTIL